jgi:SPP1 family predicted phage head-tail adaptor
MDAGKFDELVTIESYTESVSSNTGQRTQSWSTYAQVWAQVKESDFGQEPTNADRREHKTRVNFITRWDAGFNVKMRINWGGNYYNILNIAEKERRLYANLLTELTS